MLAGLQSIFASGECEIDLARRQLRVLGSPVPVGARAFEIVEVLAQSAGELVTKDELMSRVWPGAIVNDNALQVHISAVRKALGPHRAVLKTESGRGYRLLGTWTARNRDPAAVVVPQQPWVIEKTAASNIPAAASNLIGRSTTVQRLRDLVSAYRIVTLTGSGGIGKTTLALELASGLLDDFQGAAWLVELASLSDPDLVPTAVASVLGLRLGGEEISAEAVARAVGGTNLLLILDNCEHVIDAAANFVETFVRTCPRTTILVTSRETLRIDGEYVYRVPALEVPAADEEEPDQILGHSGVELFIARAKALDADFSLQAETLPAIGTICRRLDGIPLAIEFAAARAAMLGVQQVATGLDDRFALLNRGRRTALPRHRTLRATLDWSYELLSEAEQRLLRHLPIFSGGFTVEAAAAVMSEGVIGSYSVMECIANLVAKSLVALDRETASRWYLLETIRAYALEKLAEHGERHGAALRHATHFRDLFPRSGPRSHVSISADERMGRLREIDNVRSALNWCFSASGDTAIGVDLATGCAVWLRVDVSTSMFDTAHGARQSLDLLTKALGAAEALDDVYAQERALLGIITFHSFCGEHQKTRAAAERLSRVAARIGDPAVSRNADGLSGAALVMAGRPREAQGFLESYLNAVRSMPDQQRPSEPGTEGRGSPSRAFPSKALWLRGFINQARRENQASARAFLSRALWLRGYIDQAKLEAEASLDDLPAADLPFPLCRVLYYGACRIMPTTGDFAAAELSIARLIEAATRINAPFWQTAGRFLSGKLMIERGEFAQGVAVLNDAFDACRRTGWRMSYPEFKGALATGLAGLGQLDEALVAVNEGLDDVVQAEHGHDLFSAELLRIKGEILLRRQAVSAAEDFFGEALTVAREQEALLWELRAALSLARVRVKQGRGGQARRLMAHVYDRFTEGFEAPDLRAAKQLLDDLTAAHSP